MKKLNSTACHLLLSLSPSPSLHMGQILHSFSVFHHRSHLYFLPYYSFLSSLTLLLLSTIVYMCIHVWIFELPESVYGDSHLRHPICSSAVPRLH